MMRLTSFAVVVSALALLRASGLARTDDGLVAYYPCDEGTGAVLRDRSGNGNDGKLSGGVQWVKGSFGSALRLDGRDGHVDCGVGKSLNRLRTGTALLWFKPETVCQGGLVAWTKGKAASDQRFVLSLNTYVANHSRGEETFRELGVYLSDGANQYRPFVSNFHKAYFPQPDQWLFFAVTLNGQSVDLYRDGVLVHTSFQALTPDVRDVPLWIGRCSGVGGPSDYFMGLVDEVRVYQRALTEQEVYSLYMKGAPGRGKDSAAFGSIGIRPTAGAKPGMIFADLDYRGLAPTSQDLRVRAELLNRNGAIAKAGQVRMLAVWGRAEAVFDTRQLPAGEYVVRATASRGKPGTAPVVWHGRAKGWEKVRVLNNLCWELLNESPGATPEREYRFLNPRRGWVYFTTEAEGEMSLTVSSAQPPTLRLGSKALRQEAMRWLEEGEHTVTVSGGGSLRRIVARSVPTLSFGHYPHVGPDTGDDHEFLDEFVLPHVNTLITGGRYNYPHMNQSIEDWARQGKHWLQIVYRPEAPTTETGIVSWLANSTGLKDPDFHGVMIDEFDPGNDRMAWIESHYDQWIPAIEEAHRNPSRAGRMIIPYFAYNMFDYEKSTAFLKKIVAARSFLGNEVYLDEQETASKAWVSMNEALGALVDDWEKAIPGAVENMVVVLSYLSREYWNPTVDFNTFMDLQMEYLATRPEFFGLAGIEWYVSHHSHEHHIRWAAKLCRHYGLEGHTERKSKDPYVLTHLRNGDFAEGTNGWTIEAAESGSVAARNCPGFGYLEDRRPYWPYTNTSVLWTRRSKEKPNAFSQQVSNLERGRLYSLRAASGDYQEFIKGKSSEQEHTVLIELDNAEMVMDWYRTASFKNLAQVHRTWQTAGPFNGQNPYFINFHWRVFRAKGKSATLRISDWKSNTDPGGPVGQELMFNFISVQPYPER